MLAARARRCGGCFDEASPPAPPRAPPPTGSPTSCSAQLEAAGVDAAALPFGGAALAELLALVDDGTLSATAAKEVLAEMVRGGGSPRAIVAARGLAQVSDEAALGERCRASSPARPPTPPPTAAAAPACSAGSSAR